MTREDVLKLFPDATDEQITNLLNQNNTEVATEKAKVAKYKDRANQADELQKQIDAMNEQGLSDVEKANKALEAANNKIAELETKQRIADQKVTVAKKFNITADQAESVVKENGEFDYDALGKIIADKEIAAANAKEQEIAKGQSHPSGGTGGNDNQLSDAEKIATKLYGNKSEENSSGVISHYV